MLNNLSFVSKNRFSLSLLVLALIVGGVGARATGLLNTSSGGYLVCVNTKTKVVTHPGTSRCPKGSKKLILGAQGVAGTNGLTGAAGLSGKDGMDGKDGKTLWNGVKDPESSWGAPGDMFINAVTKVLFGPKNLDGSWPVGVSMVGPAGERGLTGLTGAQGPGGASGGSGATGAKGDTGATGSGGTSAPIASGTNCIGVKCTYKIGDIGPGGGLIFFVDYNDQYADFNYLEAAPTDGVFASSAATGPWATSVTNCGPSSNSSCLTYSIYTQLGVDLATIKGLHRGIFGGQAATAAIIAKHSGVDVDLYAAGVADAYSTATKSDYYLATKDEIELMQKNLNNAGVGEFKANWYWSSSEQGNAYAYVHYPGSGEQTYGTKSPKYYVRPVRSF